jgi:hypothetical protein
MRVRLVPSVAVAIVMLATELGSNARADTIVNVDFTTGTRGSFGASGTDLINNDQATTLSSLTLLGTTATGSSLADLNNGTAVWNGYSFNASFAPSDGAVVTVTLDTTSHPLGYDIDSIVSVAGFLLCDRAQQRYDVSYSLVDNPYTFIYLRGDSDTTVNQLYQTTPNTDPSRVESKVTISGFSPIATGVAQLKFTFYPVPFYAGGSDVGTCYREIDINGMATVPEPSTSALLIAGALGFICYVCWKRDRGQLPIMSTA